MKTILRFAAPAMFIAATLTFAPGCKGAKGVDKEAAEACKTDEKTKDSGDECKACCNEAGASGHSWMSGKGCTCL